MISISQEYKLAGKSAFEIWADIFGIKTKIYHADNGRFSEQPFKSEIEYSNQTIKLYGVGYHHQNTIIKRKIETLTLWFPENLLNIVPSAVWPCMTVLT